MTTRVLIADDEPLVLAGLAMVLSRAPEIQIIASVENGKAAVEEAIRCQPDVAIIDVRMPVMDGVEATRRITSQEPTANSDQRPVAVLVLSTFNIDQAVYAALRAGASGFLLKDSASSDLISATRAVADGDAWLHPAVARKLIAEFAGRPDSSLPPPEDLRLLTPRELEVLILMANGLSNSEMAARLVLGEGTVKTHVSRILMKLGLRDRTQAVVMAFRSNLMSGKKGFPP